MSNKWLYNIRHIVAGEPVQANIAGRPDTALESRTNYLKDRLDAAALGQALFDADATIAPDVLEGQPVFWNYQTQRYERALAAVENDEVTQTLVVQASSDCLGLLHKKKANTLGDVVLRGIVKMPNITNAITGTVEAGRYYLSSEQPGKLTKQRPPATVSVCYVQGAKENCAADPWVVVMPQVRDFLEDHIHYRFELTPAVIGVAALTNGHYAITVNPATDLTITPGWLPASHASFNGKAPAGAVFGYNLKGHPAISRVWPPTPISAVAVLWDKGEDLTGAFEIPLGASGLAVCDANGIWWMSDCPGDVPWTATPASSSSSLAGPECPREERMRVIVAFLRMTFGNDRSVVTSLHAADTSPIKITNCDGATARTGDLELSLDLDFLVGTPDVNGGKALKQIDNGNTFRTGWLTEGVFSDNDVVVLNGTNTRELTTAEKASFGLLPATPVTVQQGIVRLSFNDSAIDREISPQIIRLSDVVERLYRDIPYLGFPESQESSVRVRFNVPNTGLSNAPVMKISAQLFGRGAGTLPALEVKYRILPRPAGTTQEPLILTDNTTPLTFASAVAVNADNAIEVQTAEFNVAQGDTVLVTLRRTATDTYTSEVGLLRLAGIITISGS